MKVNRFIKYFTLSAATFISMTAATTTFAGNYVVGVESTEYLPISHVQGGNYSGYARDLLDAFAAKYGHTFTYKALPVPRLWDEFLTAKSLDLKFPDNSYWNADAKKGITVTYSKGLVSVTEGLLVLPANKGKLAGASLSKLSTLRGFTPYPYLDSIKSSKVKVSEVNSTDAAISMAAEGHVDGAYLGVMAANYVMTEQMKKPGELVFDEKLPNSTNDFALSSISHPEIVKQMDEFLVKEKDLVAKIKAKNKILE